MFTFIKILKKSVVKNYNDTRLSMNIRSELWILSSEYNYWDLKVKNPFFHIPTKKNKRYTDGQPKVIYFQNIKNGLKFFITI